MSRLGDGLRLGQGLQRLVGVGGRNEGWLSIRRHRFLIAVDGDNECSVVEPSKDLVVARVG